MPGNLKTHFTLFPAMGNNGVPIMRLRVVLPLPPAVENKPKQLII
jgi:hypothetical protein